MLSSTNTKIYNLIHDNVVRWWNGTFCFQKYGTLPNGDRTKYIPVANEQALADKSHVSSWTVLIEGPSIGFLDNQQDADAANTTCKRETAKVLFYLCQLDVTKIRKVIFSGMDMLAPEMIALTRGRPFNLREIQLLKCRKFTMQRAAANLRGFFTGKGEMKITRAQEDASSRYTFVSLFIQVGKDVKPKLSRNEQKATVSTATSTVFCQLIFMQNIKHVKEKITVAREAQPKLEVGEGVPGPSRSYPIYIYTASLSDHLNAKEKRSATTLSAKKVQKRL